MGHHAFYESAVVGLGDLCEDGGDLGDSSAGADQTSGCFVAGVGCLNDVGGAAGDGDGGISLDDNGVGCLGAEAIDVAA